MGKRIDQLRDEKAETVQGMESLNETLATEERDRTPEEVTMCEGWQARLGAIDNELAYLEEADEARRQQAAVATITPDVPVGAERDSGIPKHLARYGRAPAFGMDREGQERAYRAGKWCRAAIFGDTKARNWCDEHEVRVMNETANSAGGVLVPEEFSTTVVQLIEQYGVFRRKAQVIPMGSDQMNVPVRTAGLTGYFVGEEDAITASDMTFKNASLTTRTLATLTKVSRNLDEDAVVTVANILATEIASIMANTEDKCGFIGDGASTYGGCVGLITAIPAGGDIEAASGNTAFSTLDMVDFEDCIGALPEYPGMQPEWYIHKAAWAASMMRLADAAGGNTVVDIGNGPQMSFLGYPVNFVQVANSTLAAQTDGEGGAYFGDLSMAALFGSRRGVGIQTTTERYIEYQQIGVIGTERFDVNCHSCGTASAAGAMVMLTFPGS